MRFLISFFAIIFSCACSAPSPDIVLPISPDTLLVHTRLNVDSTFKLNSIFGSMNIRVRAPEIIDSILIRNFHQPDSVPGRLREHPRRDTVIIRHFGKSIQLEINSDSSGNSILVLADKAIYTLSKDAAKRKNCWNLNGKVKMCVMQDTLRLQHLTWDLNRLEWYSEDIFRMTSNENAITGKGFHGNFMLTRYTINEVISSINLKN